MAKRQKLNLSSDEIEKLTEISKSRVQSASRVQRAKVLLHYYNGEKISQIKEI